MSPFDSLKANLIIPLIKSNPDASDNEIMRLAVRHFEKNEASRHLCYEYFIKNALGSVERVKPQGNNSIAVLPRARVTAPPPAPVRAEVEHRVSTPQTRKEIVAEVKRVAPAAPPLVQKRIIAEVEKRLDNPTIRTQIAAEAAQNIPADTQRISAPMRAEVVTAAVSKAVTVEVPKAVERVDRVEAAKTEAIACVLLNFVLPNGLQVRDATFGDMAKFGGWATAVSKLGPANAKVGGLKGVSEEVLQNIMRRFTAETQPAAA